MKIHRDLERIILNRRLRTRFTAHAIIEYLDFKPIEDMFTGAVAGRFRTKFRL